MARKLKVFSGLTFEDGEQVETIIATTSKKKVSEMREELKEFQEDWLVEHEQNPEDYPLELGKQEWFEHYLAWVNTK